MPEETISATLTPPAEEGSYEAWEATQKEAAPAQQPKAEEPEKPSVPKGQTAAVPETAPAQEQKPPQQAQQPKRKHDAESRIGELTKREKEALARAEAAERQLEDLRKTSVSQESRPAPEASKPASQPAANLSDLDEYVKAEHAKRPEVLQERLIQEWFVQELGRREKQAQIQHSMRDFRAKHPDIADDVFGENGKQGIILGTPQVNVMKPLMDNFQNWPDVLHYLHEHPDVYQQVRASSPQEQWFDVVAIARQLSRGIISVAPAAETPVQEQPRSNVRPISRVPAPAKHVLGGGMPPEGKTIRDARDFEEAEAIERRRTAGGR